MRQIRSLAVLVALTWLAMGPGASARAQERGVEADRYDVEIAIEGDGSLVVVERLTLDFTGGPFRHGFSTLWLGRVEAIRDVRVGEPGRPYAPGRDEAQTYSARYDGDRVRIDWWFP